MPPLYFIPDRYSRLLSDHSREGSVFFRGDRDLPEDIHWRCLCHLCCRYLSEGKGWPELLVMLDVEDEDALAGYFRSYTGMSPSEYGQWCLGRRKNLNPSL